MFTLDTAEIFICLGIGGGFIVGLFLGKWNERIKLDSHIRNLFVKKSVNELLAIRNQVRNELRGK